MIPFNQLSLVVFDLDGTLVDTFRDIQAATNHALAALGRAPLPLETVSGFVGNGAEMLMRRALQSDDAQRVQQGVALWKEYAAAHPADQAQLYPEALEFLQFLREHGIKRAVLSNKLHDVCRSIFATLGVDSLFDAIWGDRPGFSCKPDPAALHALMRELGATPATTLLVGDGEPDMRVAKAAGVWSCGAAWGQNTAERLKALGADYVAGNFSELLQYATRAIVL